MAENVSCSFASFSDHRCDIFQPDIKEYFFVTSCAKEVRCYLREVKMSETSVSTENALIFAQTGLFSDDVARRTICLRHRAELGLMWTPRRKCAHPLHGTKKKPTTTITTRNGSRPSYE